MVQEGPPFQTDELPKPNTVVKEARILREGELGFGWGKLCIVFGYLSGATALFGFVMGATTGDLSEEPVSLLIFGLPMLACAYGLHRRRRFGFYLALVLSVMHALGGLLELVSGEDLGGRPAGLVGLVVGLLWFDYFRRRRGLFT